MIRGLAIGLLVAMGAGAVAIAKAVSAAPHADPIEGLFLGWPGGVA